MSASSSRAPTGIVLLNMGGPRTLDDVGPFLLRLFEDREIIQLPMQGFLGPFIAKRRTPSVQALYDAIGGGSPILEWTEKQGQGMVERLDARAPETAPHRFYVAFRYTEPFAEDALRRMREDGVERAIAFSQYPHYSCATTGSSLNDLWAAARLLGLEDAFRWSVIDRWPTHPGFIDAMTHTVRKGLEAFPPEVRDDVLILFSAHSLPLAIVNRGDPYPQEVAASVHEVMKRLDYAYEYLLSYQSEVGPVSWLGPSTEKVIEHLGARGRKHVLVVGIAFTNDHIETLSEIDFEYAELARHVGIEHFVRAPALNDEPIFLDALAEIVRQHLAEERPCTRQYPFRCPGCENPACRQLPNPAWPLASLRPSAVGGSRGPGSR